MQSPSPRVRLVCFLPHGDASPLGLAPCGPGAHRVVLAPGVQGDRWRSRGRRTAPTDRAPDGPALEGAAGAGLCVLTTLAIGTWSAGQARDRKAWARILTLPPTGCHFRQVHEPPNPMRGRHVDRAQRADAGDRSPTEKKPEQCRRGLCRDGSEGAAPRDSAAGRAAQLPARTQRPG